MPPPILLLERTNLITMTGLFGIPDGTFSAAWQFTAVERIRGKEKRRSRSTSPFLNRCSKKSIFSDTCHQRRQFLFFPLFQIRPPIHVGIFVQPNHYGSFDEAQDCSVKSVPFVDETYPGVPHVDFLVRIFTEYVLDFGNDVFLRFHGSFVLSDGTKIAEYIACFGQARNFRRSRRDFKDRDDVSRHHDDHYDNVRDDITDSFMLEVPPGFRNSRKR